MLEFKSILASGFSVGVTFGTKVGHTVYHHCPHGLSEFSYYYNTVDVQYLGAHLAPLSQAL